MDNNEPKVGERLTIAQAAEAFANGYQLQFISPSSEGWRDLPTISEVESGNNMISFCGVEQYRIAPAEPKLRPYTAEEFKDLILSGKVPYVIDMDIERKCIIRCYEYNRIWLGNRNLGITLADAAEKLTWADGTPFGIMEGE